MQVGANKAVLKETYSLVGDGDRMAFIFILESKLSEVPIQFRVVYDRVEDEEPARKAFRASSTFG